MPLIKDKYCIVFLVQNKWLDIRYVCLISLTVPTSSKKKALGESKPPPTAFRWLADSDGGWRIRIDIQTG